MRKPPFPLPFLADGVSAAQMREAGMKKDDCASRWALGHPDFVRRQTARFCKAGAGAVLAPTLAANRSALASLGLESRVRELNAGVLRLVAEGAGGLPVGARIGPSGIAFSYEEADCFDEIFAVYREQIRILDEAGASFLMIERQTSLADMRAAMLAARSTDLPVFVTMTPDPFSDTDELLPPLITLQAMGADAIGVDNLPVSDAQERLRELFPHAEVPLAARLSALQAASPEAYAENAALLARAGACVFGAGEGGTPAFTAALAARCPAFPVPEPHEADCRAAASADGVFFLGDDIELSEPVLCSSRLDDDLIELEHGSANVGLVRVESLDDAMLLAEHGPLARLPLAVWADSLPVLEAALRYFQGRLLVDSSSPLEEEMLAALANKYGAIVY